MKKFAFTVLGLALVLILPCGSAAAQEIAKPQEPRHGNGSEGREGVMGTISSVGVDRFEIKKMDGKVQAILVDGQTRFREEQKEINLEDLKPGDHVMVRGKMSDKEEFAALGVRRITEQEIQRFQIGAGERAFGQIVAIDNNRIKIHNEIQGDKTVVVNYQTVLMKDGQPITLQDLKAGDRIFARGNETNGEFVATRVMSGQFPRGGQAGRERPKDFGQSLRCRDNWPVAGGHSALAKTPGW